MTKTRQDLRVVTRYVLGIVDDMTEGRYHSIAALEKQEVVRYNDSEQINDVNYNW